MVSYSFMIDNVQSHINYPAKTTVGIGVKFTNNRRYFANLISTPQFKEMLAKDEEALRNGFIEKMKYCNDVIMDKEILNDFYDREVDQSKL